MEFERLIETERQNDALLHRAREEADALRQAAVEAAEQREASLAAELARALRESADTFSRQRAASLAEVAAQAAREAARFDAVDDAAIQAVIPVLMAALLGTDGER